VRLFWGAMIGCNGVIVMHIGDALGWALETLDIFSVFWGVAFFPGYPLLRVWEGPRPYIILLNTS
jgi:hypothetical protein